LKLTPEHGDCFRGLEVSLGERSFAGKHCIPRTRARINPHYEFLGRRADESSLDGGPQDRPVTSGPDRDDPGK